VDAFLQGIDHVGPCHSPIKAQNFLYAGQVTQNPPHPPPPLPGGILGDEMGLGKTAEMHALMVARPRPTPSPTKCPKHLTSTSTSQASQKLSSGGLTEMDVDAVSTSQADVDAERVSTGKHASSSMPSSLVTGSRGTYVKEEEAKNMGNGGLRRLAGLVPGSNLVVCPMQLKDQWINEVPFAMLSASTVVTNVLLNNHCIVAMKYSALLCILLLAVLAAYHRSGAICLQPSITRQHFSF